MCVCVCVCVLRCAHNATIHIVAQLVRALERKRKIFVMEKERRIPFEAAMMRCTSEKALEEEGEEPSAEELELVTAIIEVALDDRAAVPSVLIDRIREVDRLFERSGARDPNDPDPQLRTAPGECVVASPNCPDLHFATSCTLFSCGCMCTSQHQRVGAARM